MIGENALARDFIEPLETSGLQGYDELIPRKMCLNDVLQNLNAKRIKTIQEFANDTELIFNNCIKYWSHSYGDDNLYVIIAKTLKEDFKKEVERIPASYEQEWLMNIQDTAKKLAAYRERFVTQLENTIKTKRN